MKELKAFRKFLAEGEANGFIFWFREGAEEELKKAKEILDREGISFTSPGAMALEFPASEDEKNIKSILWKNGVSKYVISQNIYSKENIKDRGEFGQESLDKLFDTVEAMGEGPVQQKAMDMMEDGAFFPEEGTSPAVNQTQEAVEELNYAKNTNNEETIEEAKLFLDAIILIKNAVKEIGPVSYGEMGQSYNYYVEGDDLFTQTRETFEVPTNEGVYDIQLTPEPLRTEFYSAIITMDNALSKSKGGIPLEQWDALYAVVTKVEDVAQYIGD